MKLLRNAVFSIGLAVAASSASALTQLGAALDASGSVSGADFILQLNGWADAVGNLPTDGSVEVTVVQFGGFDEAQVEVAPTVIDSEATRTAVATAINGISKLGGGTPINVGIDTLVTAMTGSANFNPGTNESIINLATDGVANSQSAAIASAQAAEAAGIDALTIEAVGAASIASALQLVFNPGCSVNTGCGVALPADSLPPNPLTGSAWVLPVTDFNAFGAAIDNKIGVIIGRVPEPQMLALLAIGLVGVGTAARRRRV